MYLKKIPRYLRLLSNNIIWEKPDSDKLYLSFDDGPDPNSTPQLLELLDLLKIKASFFCIGEKVEAYPMLYNEIIKRGHLVGNHGYHHISGWKTTKADYITNVRKAASLYSNKLFRPPYGKFTLNQYLSLKKEFKIVMWGYMPGDFDPKHSKEDMIQLARKSYPPGSIIVLHDSPKCMDKTKTFLNSICSKYKDFGLLA